ncbi:MAG TPA: hypothetical protein VN796_09125 [Acidimicrobiales bacterium]|nr:hypothetical protein [Acidimicrobiales bacterium]
MPIATDSTECRAAPSDRAAPAVPAGRLRGGLGGGGRLSAVVATALVLAGFGLTGCSIVKAAEKVKHDVEGNKATIDTFTNKIQSGAATTFEATYVTTGSSPATIVYAVQPPKGLAFTDTPSSGSGAKIDLVVNATGEYSCSPPSGSSSTWTCQKLGTADAAAQNKIFDFYTPAHWIGFLKDFSLVAGIAGDKVTSSTMAVNGFNMSCVDFVAPGVSGTSTICTTAQGILGYVKVAQDSTSFEIKSYSGSPPASLFQIPPGAKVTTAQSGTTGTT